MPRVIARMPDIQLDRRGSEIQQWLDDALRLAPQHKIRRYAILDDKVEPILEVIPCQHVFTRDPLQYLTPKVAD